LELPDDLADWPLEWRDALAERLAIMQVDGNVAPCEAQRLAEASVRAEHRRRQQGDLRVTTGVEPPPERRLGDDMREPSGDAMSMQTEFPVGTDQIAQTSDSSTGEPVIAKSTEKGCPQLQMITEESVVTHLPESERNGDGEADR